MRVLAQPLAGLFLPVLAGLLTISPPAAAHPGGLDASGCHTDRKTGELPLPPGGAGPGDQRSEPRGGSVGGGEAGGG